ncbi:hypothetical protein [Desulforegula conservatrix]|uniref:hypothetical protein n=1 Tax=Desulforegula conservatrix TaxID=153026 RepID=UPI0004119134|nr:hypothetical protein [Desulforegula conservatrix]
MPETKSAAKSEIKKAVIITDPKNGVLTIAIPMDFEGSETTEAGPMDALVDFLQTFCLAPEKKPEQEASEDFRIPCPYYSQCRSIEDPKEIKAEPETASSELTQSGLPPEQELRLKCLKSARVYAQHHDAYTLTDIAEIFFKWVTLALPTKPKTD